MGGLAAGDVPEVTATERNSLPDFESRTGITDGVELVDQVEDEDEDEADGEPACRHDVGTTG